MSENDLTQQAELTFGESLVGVGLNPSKNPDVNKVKELCALMVNIVMDQKKPEDPLHTICKDNALQQLLIAQMSIVKYLTL